MCVTQQQNKYFPYDRICPIPNYNNGLTSRWSQQPRLPRCSYQLILVECSSVPPILPAVDNGHWDWNFRETFRHYTSGPYIESSRDLVYTEHSITSEHRKLAYSRKAVSSSFSPPVNMKIRKHRGYPAHNSPPPAERRMAVSTCSTAALHCSAVSGEQCYSEGQTMGGGTICCSNA